MKLEFSELGPGASALIALANEIEGQSNKMTQDVGNLCESWESESKPFYYENFMTVAGAISKATEAARELGKALENYVKDHEEIEHRNSGR